MYKQIFLLLLVTSFFPACKKDNENPAELLTEAEAAELVEAAASERTAGLGQTTSIMTGILANPGDFCGQTNDTSFQRSQSIGPVTYFAGYDIQWTVNCNNLNVPQNAQVDLTEVRNFSSTRWDGAGAGSGDLTVSGLNPSSTACTFNGAYATNGQLTGSIRQSHPTFSCITQFDLANLAVRKSDGAITSGSAVVSITATASNGTTQTLSGTLVFNGDGTATVTIQGYSYTFGL